jgi:hypothetical protein
MLISHCIHTGFVWVLRKFTKASDRLQLPPPPPLFYRCYCKTLRSQRNRRRGESRCDRTDAYIVAALNKDVGTFNSMAQALHYHMFQHVIVANCGQYRGSVVQAPFKESFDRTVLHHHGHEQAIVSFFELDLKTYRTKAAKSNSQAPKKRISSGKELKTPPAGYGGRIY